MTQCFEQNRFSSLPIFRQNESVHAVARFTEDALAVNLAGDVVATTLKAGGRLGTRTPLAGGISMVARLAGRAVGQALGRPSLTGAARMGGKAASEALLLHRRSWARTYGTIQAQCFVGAL